MNLFRYNHDLILGDLPLPEGFSAVAPVTTEKYPLGAVLLQNAAGIYWIWSGGALSGCDQREAARFVRELKENGQENAWGRKGQRVTTEAEKGE
jgi:hypothetical protein